MDEVKRIAEQFLSLVRDDSQHEEDALAHLERALDALAFARHGVSFAFDDRDLPDPPDWPYTERRAVAAARFPSLGLYNVASPVSERVGEGEVGVGDAIDDIADIAGDLHDCVWRWEHNGAADALWHFEFTFAHHWGEHLRALQVYLLARRNGQ